MSITRWRFSGPAVACMLAAAGLSVPAGTSAAGEEDVEQGPRVGERLARRGDEIVACGQLYHTTAPVVLWTDPGGYDAYRVERRFVPLDQASWAKTRDAISPASAAPIATACGSRG